MTRKPTAPEWQNMPNAARKRPMVTITISREALAELDRRRADLGRGAYIELLLKNKSKKSTRKA